MGHWDQTQEVATPSFFLTATKFHSRAIHIWAQDNCRWLAIGTMRLSQAL